MKLTNRMCALVIAMVLSMFVTHFAVAADNYNYISIEQLKARLDAGDYAKGSLSIVTTQTDKEYASGHLKEAIATFARPLESDADFAKLDPFLKKIKGSSEDVVVISPRGKSGAERPYDYFVKSGVAEKRLLILKGGQEAYTKAYPNDVAYGK